MAVGAVVALNVASGGMRGITYVQAFQYWMKTFAIALPACLLLIHLGGLPERAAMFGHELPRAGDAGLVVELDEPQPVTFPEATTYTVDGAPAEAAEDEELTLPAGELELPPGAVVPVADGIEAQTGEDWARPVESGGPTSPVFVYSLLLATFLGHDGPAAHPRPLLHQPGRAGGAADDRARARPAGDLLRVPGRLRHARPRARARALPDGRDRLGRAAPARGGVAGARRRAARRAGRGRRVRGLHVDRVGPDGLGRRNDLLRPLARAARRRWTPRRRRFRLAALGGVVAPVALALVARGLDISVLVGWAFALAASTFCPLLLLGIWWEGLTARGAAAGLVAGATVATGAIFTGLALEDGHPTVNALLTQPAVLSVPVAFAVMVVVSLADRGGRRTADAELLAMHAPEGLGLDPAQEEAARPHRITPP